MPINHHNHSTTTQHRQPIKTTMAELIIIRKTATKMDTRMTIINNKIAHCTMTP